MVSEHATKIGTSHSLWLSRAALGFVALAAVMGWGASFVGLHAYGHDQMVGFNYWTAWLVPGTFDGAAFGATLITYRASIHGRSAMRGRLLMWTFTAISSWINWIHQVTPEARLVAAGLPVAAVAVFDVVLAELRADYEERHGKRRLRLRPGLLVLRWLVDRTGTSGAFRRQVTDIPVSEIAGLGHPPSAVEEDRDAILAAPARVAEAEFVTTSHDDSARRSPVVVDDGESSVVEATVSARTEDSVDRPADEVDQAAVVVDGVAATESVAGSVPTTREHGDAPAESSGVSQPDIAHEAEPVPDTVDEAEKRVADEAASVGEESTESLDSTRSSAELSGAKDSDEPPGPSRSQFPHESADGSEVMNDEGAREDAEPAPDNGDEHAPVSASGQTAEEDENHDAATPSAAAPETDGDVAESGDDPAQWQPDHEIEMVSAEETAEETETTLTLPPVPDEPLNDADKRTLARRDYRLSAAAGQPLSGAQLGTRYGFSERWGRTQITAARGEFKQEQAQRQEPSLVAADAGDNAR